jgi:hypothetical protein
LPSKLATTRDVRELLENFPAEKTLEATEKRRMELTSRPEPLIKLVGDPAPAAPCDASEEKPGETGAEDKVESEKFSPPPRKAAEPKMKKKESADKAAERESKYEAAQAELRAACEEEGFSMPGDVVPLRKAKVEVNGAGEHRLNGIYEARFATKDRVEYSRVGDEQCQVYWTEYQDEWRMLIGDFKMGNTLYRHKYRPNLKADECHGIPVEGWQKWFGNGPVPTIRYLTEEQAEQAKEGEAPFPDSGPVNEDAVGNSQGETGAGAEAQPSSPSLNQNRGEFLELHPSLEIIHGKEDAATNREPLLAVDNVQVSLVDGERIVETADGLFSPGEVPTI